MSKPDVESPKVYVDANVLIYFVEGAQAFRVGARRLFAETALRGAVIVTSELSIAECLHGAYKRNDDTLAGNYRELFGAQSLIALVPVSAPLLDSSARLGAALAVKTLDAIHVASAVQIDAEYLVTNDRSMRAPRTMRLRRLAEWL